MRDYTNEFKTIAEECGDADKFNNIQLRQGCYAYFLHGINYGEQERASLQSQLSESMAHIERLRDGLINICEYWNGDSGIAAVDAIEHVMVVANELLEETPAQSLSEIRAQGVDEFAANLDELAQAECPGRPHKTIPSSYADYARNFSARLRQQGKDKPDKRSCMYDEYDEVE